MAEQVDFYSFACPASAPFFGYFGAASAMALANFGAAYGTAKAGAGISGMGVSRPDLVMKALIPVVMAGVVGIYGLIIAVIISTKGEGPRPALSPVALGCFCGVQLAGATDRGCACGGDLGGCEGQLGARCRERGEAREGVERWRGGRGTWRRVWALGLVPAQWHGEAPSV